MGARSRLDELFVMRFSGIWKRTFWNNLALVQRRAEHPLKEIVGRNLARVSNHNPRPLLERLPDKQG